MDEPAVVRLLDPLATSQERLPASILEWSDPFMMLRLPRPVLVASMLQVRYQDQIVLGEVRGCAPAGDSYDVRIQLQDVFRTGEAP